MRWNKLFATVSELRAIDMTNDTPQPSKTKDPAHPVPLLPQSRISAHSLSANSFQLPSETGASKPNTKAQLKYKSPKDAGDDTESQTFFGEILKAETSAWDSPALETPHKTTGACLSHNSVGNLSLAPSVSPNIYLKESSNKFDCIG